MLDAISAAGQEVLAVGKISDIFAGRGITDRFFTHGNNEGEERTLELTQRDFEGLLFVNLVDFDMLYGHRRDVEGYAGQAAADAAAGRPADRHGRPRLRSYL